MKNDLEVREPVFFNLAICSSFANKKNGWATRLIARREEGLRAGSHQMAPSGPSVVPATSNGRGSGAHPLACNPSLRIAFGVGHSCFASSPPQHSRPPRHLGTLPSATSPLLPLRSYLFAFLLTCCPAWSLGFVALAPTSSSPIAQLGVLVLPRSLQLPSHLLPSLESRFCRVRSNLALTC